MKGAPIDRLSTDASAFVAIVTDLIKVILTCATEMLRFYKASGKDEVPRIRHLDVLLLYVF